MNEDKLRRYLDEIVQGMLAGLMVADFRKPGEADRVMLRLNRILRQFDKRLEDFVPADLLKAYKEGADEATKQMRQAGLAVTPLLQVTASGGVVQGFQSVIHTMAVEGLIADTMLDLKAAIRTAEASGITAIREVLDAVQADLTKGLIVGQARKRLTQQVMETFLERGMTAFLTKDNRRLPLDFYAMTVVRTKTRHAHIQGSVNRYTEAGQDLVQIIGNPDCCEKCAQFRGLVVSRNGLTEGFPVVGMDGILLPPFHPNCRCGVAPFILAFKTPAEIRKAQAFNAGYAPGKDRRTAAQKAAYDREQELRRKANAEKKQFMRWQATLGAEAPKTLAAFRRMKRQNTVRFQELQSEIRSEGQYRRYR